MNRALHWTANVLPLRTRLWVKHIPGLAAMQRWAVRRFLSDKSFVHTINTGPARGLRLEVTLPDDKAMWLGTFEHSFAEVLRKAISPGDVCYDIGGYRGYMSGVLAIAGASRVIAFEPFPPNAQRIRRLIELNPDLPVQLEEVAVGERDGEASFKVMPDASMGKLVESTFQRDAAGEREQSVSLASVDFLVGNGGLPPPSLMKIDVEGAEVGVLAGAARTIAQHRPKIFLEAHSEALAAQCTSFLSAFGYRLRQLEPGVIPAEQARHIAAEPAAG
jgi:FkbM family methyltransferase